MRRRRRLGFLGRPMMASRRIAAVVLWGACGVGADAPGRADRRRGNRQRRGWRGGSGQWEGGETKGHKGGLGVWTEKQS